MSDGARSATKLRRLRSGVPLWLGRGHARIAHSQLEQDLEIDIAVVGAGISGALVTDALLTTGARVAVLDRRGPVRGSTPASTALVQGDLDQPFIELAKKIGRRDAAAAYWRSAAAVGALRARIADLRLRCGLREHAAVYLPGNVLDIAGLRKEGAERARIGLRSRFIGADELRGLTGISGKGALLTEAASELDPVALTRGLLRHAVQNGARVFAPCEVTAIADDRRGVALTTEDGHVVRCKHAVFATGYELVKLVHARGHEVISTWAMATAAQPERLWPSRCQIWEAADPYLYVRTTPDGRVLAGGEDADFSDEAKRDALLPKKVAAIRRKLSALLPRLHTQPEFAWAGCFGRTPTGMPTIGAIPGHPRCHAILGYGGNGITFSMIAAQIVQRSILGLEDPDAHLFAFPHGRR